MIAPAAGLAIGVGGIVITPVLAVVFGTGLKALGSALTGDDSLKNEGKVDQATGTVKDKVGDASDKVKDVIDKD